MTATMRDIPVQTKGDGHVLDLTEQVNQAVDEAGLRDGAALVFVSGSTAAVTTIEHEPGAVADLAAVLERLIPRQASYAHNHGGDSNGYAHVRAAIVGPSVTVPVVGGRLLLGTWQQIVLVEFDDRPRSRRVHVQTMG